MIHKCCNSIFTVRVLYAYVIPEGNLRTLHKHNGERSNERVCAAHAWSDRSWYHIEYNFCGSSLVGFGTFLPRGTLSCKARYCDRMSSVRLSVRVSSVCLSVTLVDCDYIGWNSSKIIPPLVSLGCSLFATPTWRVCSKGNTPKFGPKVTHPCWFERWRHLIANCGRMVTDTATVTMESL